MKGTDFFLDEFYATVYFSKSPPFKVDKFTKKADHLQTPFWPRRDDCFSYSVCYANLKPRCKPSNLVSKLLQPNGNLSERNNKNKFQFRFRKKNIHFKIVFLFGNQVEIMIIFLFMYRD